jgi:CheY-like chemotaxis protein
LIAPSVLIVDDEEAIGDNLAAFLQDEGMRTIVAHSGEEAIALVRGGLAADVCIMDLRLPGISGTGAILAIREQQPGMHFIVHTGSASDRVIAELKRTGLQDIKAFSKPVHDMNLLAEAVNSLWTSREHAQSP